MNPISRSARKIVGSLPKHKGNDFDNSENHGYAGLFFIIACLATSGLLLCCHFGIMR